MVDALRETLDAALRRLSPKSDMARLSPTARSDSRHCAAISMTAAWRSTTISPNVRCAALPSDDATGCSPVQKRGARRGDLHRHPDLQGQRRRPAGLHRRRHWEDRSGLARSAMGRTYALELVRANRRASGASRVICGLPATLTKQQRRAASAH
jgi:hypothetical protein